ncbi:MAG: hypothetical protein AAGJ32_05855 [Pseudomonadota bacterium]
MNDLSLENWIGLAIVLSGVLLANWIGGLVAASVDPNKTNRSSPPAE